MIARPPSTVPVPEAVALHRGEPVDLTAYPDSAVPAAFDRGHLYSPTLDQTRYALAA